MSEQSRSSCALYAAPHRSSSQLSSLHSSDDPPQASRDAKPLTLARQRGGRHHGTTPARLHRRRTVSHRAAGQSRASWRTRHGWDRHGRHSRRQARHLGTRTSRGHFALGASRRVNVRGLTFIRSWSRSSRASRFCRSPTTDSKGSSSRSSSPSRSCAPHPQPGAPRTTRARQAGPRAKTKPNQHRAQRCTPQRMPRQCSRNEMRAMRRPDRGSTSSHSLGARCASPFFHADSKGSLPASAGPDCVLPKAGADYHPQLGRPRRRNDGVSRPVACAAEYSWVRRFRKCCISYQSWNWSGAVSVELLIEGECVPPKLETWRALRPTSASSWRRGRDWTFRVTTTSPDPLMPRELRTSTLLA